MPDPIQIEQMTLAEKLQAMEELWQSLCRHEEEIPAPPWQKGILEERQALIEQGKGRFSSMETARKRLAGNPK